MNTVTLKFGKDEAKRLLNYLDIIKELTESPYEEQFCKSVRGYKVSKLKLFSMIKYIEKQII